MDRIKNRLYQFMIGRYGNDELSYFLLITAVVLLGLTGVLFREPSTANGILRLIPLFLMFYVNYRTFSKNIPARRGELLKYYKVKGQITKPFGALKRAVFGTKTHSYFRCPNCREGLRLPKGKGKLKVTCPKCQHVFVKRT